MNTKIALRRDVRCIPMINTWYANPFLISPLTFGLIAKGQHIPLLDSFLESPETHSQCIQTPALRGGPFVDYSGDPQNISHLIKRTSERCAPQLQLADAIPGTHALAREKATGSGLAPLYEQLDPLLRGCVEFSYDAMKKPIVRFIESALYRKLATHAELQSCRLEPASMAERPFFLTTPLLEASKDTVELNVPFSHPVWDRLFMRDTAATIDEWAEYLTPLLKNGARDLDAMLNLFDDGSRRVKRNPPRADEVRVRYFGHACVLMESGGKSVLVDPLVSYPGESTVDRFTLDDLPDHIDYVLITHAHVDHFVLETLLQLRHKIGCVVVGRNGGDSLVDISLKLALNHCGFDRVLEIGEHEEIEFEGGKIVGAPFFGEHADLDIRTKTVFGVVIDGISCAFLADSNPPFPECYAMFREMLPRLDCLFLGMECVGAPATWSYGPLLQQPLTRPEDQSRRLNGSDADTAERLQDFISPGSLYVYAMGAEPWVTHLSNIVYSEDLPQFKQARSFLETSKSKGKYAELLYGRMERSFVTATLSPQKSD